MLRNLIDDGTQSIDLNDLTYKFRSDVMSLSNLLFRFMLATVKK